MRENKLKTATVYSLLFDLASVWLLHILEMSKSDESVHGFLDSHSNNYCENKKKQLLVSFAFRFKQKSRRHQTCFLAPVFLKRKHNTLTKNTGHCLPNKSKPVCEKSAIFEQIEKIIPKK